jgi:hypothetical protein
MYLALWAGCNKGLCSCLYGFLEPVYLHGFGAP